MMREIGSEGSNLVTYRSRITKSLRSGKVTKTISEKRRRRELELVISLEFHIIVQFKTRPWSKILNGE